MKNNLQDKLTVVVLGRSGSGKGTQARFILARLKKRGVHHMETGRFLRELLEKKNATTEIARVRVMEQGGLFPWWFPMFLWLREMIERGYADRHMLGDGTPRRLDEAKFLDAVMAWHGRPLPLCIYIDASEKETTRRLLLRGRQDDNIAAIKNRLAYFPKNVLPVIRYYRRHNRLIRINGNQPPAAVSRDIDRALARRLKKQWPLPSKHAKK